jgi:uncharacterized protein YndB with AHSA1/START domain
VDTYYKGHGPPDLQAKDADRARAFRLQNSIDDVRDEREMILRDTVQVRCPPERVWRLIEDPERIKSWNPKIQRIAPISWGERSIGYRYRLTYVLGNRENDFLAEIVEYQKPVKLVIHLTEGNLPHDGYIREIYELSENKDGTLLKQRIEINNSDVNIFLQFLMVVIHRIGRPVAKKYLAGLKELAEGSL